MFGGEDHLCYKCGRIWERIENGEVDSVMTTCNFPGLECGMAYNGEDYNETFDAKSVDNGGGYWVTECSHFIQVPYKDYMKSKTWMATRNARLKKDGYKCVMCGSAINLCVHHINYENLGNEPLDDLITVCAKCHKKLHETDAQNK